MLFNSMFCNSTFYYYNKKSECYAHQYVNFSLEENQYVVYLYIKTLQHKCFSMFCISISNLSIKRTQYVLSFIKICMFFTFLF